MNLDVKSLIIQLIKTPLTMVSRRRGSDDLDSAQQQSCSSSASSFDHLASTTMSLDLNDPHIIMAYDAVLHNDPLRWYANVNTSS